MKPITHCIDCGKPADLTTVRPVCGPCYDAAEAEYEARAHEVPAA